VRQPEGACGSLRRWLRLRRGTAGRGQVAPLIPQGGVLHLLIGFRLDEQSSHYSARRLSIRCFTSSQATPAVSPARARRARRSISEAQALSISSGSSVSGPPSRLASSSAATSARSLWGSFRASSRRAWRVMSPKYTTRHLAPDRPAEDGRCVIVGLPVYPAAAAARRPRPRRCRQHPLPHRQGDLDRPQWWHIRYHGAAATGRARHERARRSVAVETRGFREASIPRRQRAVRDLYLCSAGARVRRGGDAPSG